MQACKELQILLEATLLPDLEGAIDELFEEIAGAKKADTEAKESYAQMQELRTALQELLRDLQEGELSEEECREIQDELSDLIEEDESDV